MRLGPVELLLILGIAVFLFGATKLPVLAKSMGESLRIFKHEVHAADEDKTEGHEQTE